jgi:hypothetical protein
MLILILLQMSSKQQTYFDFELRVVFHLCLILILLFHRQDEAGWKSKLNLPAKDKRVKTTVS